MENSDEDDGSMCLEELGKAVNKKKSVVAKITELYRLKIYAKIC